MNNLISQEIALIKRKKSIFSLTKIISIKTKRHFEIREQNLVTLGRVHFLRCLRMKFWCVRFFFAALQVHLQKTLYLLIGEMVNKFLSNENTQNSLLSSSRLHPTNWFLKIKTKIIFSFKQLTFWWTIYCRWAPLCCFVSRRFDYDWRRNDLPDWIDG